MNELVLLKKFGCLEIQGIKYVKIVSDYGPKKAKSQRINIKFAQQEFKINHQNIKKFQLKTTHKCTYENYE